MSKTEDLEIIFSKTIRGALCIIHKYIIIYYTENYKYA